LAALVAARPVMPAGADEYVTTNPGVRLHYRVLGSGPDALVIPGESWWAGYAHALARGRRVVVYDPRNRGRSDPVADVSSLGLEHDIHDLEALRRHLSLNRMTLVGWSYLGAMVALYAAEHPDRAAAVVQVGPLSPRRDPYWDQYLKDQVARLDPEEQRQLAAMRDAGLPEREPKAYCQAYWPAFVRATLGRPAAVPTAVPADLCDLANEWPQRIAVSLGKVVGGLGAWDWTSKARAVRARVLVVHGGRDNIPLESSREWARLLPDARLLVLDDSGHFPFAEQPQEFARAVDEFVSGGWPPGAVKPPPGPATQTRSGFADVAGGPLYYEISAEGLNRHLTSFLSHVALKASAH
jgi:proline iminopeptidase